MRKLFFILFSFFFTVVSFGQINISVRAGGNIATTKSLIAFPKNRLGWYSGLIFKIPIQKKLFIQPELLYSSKGYKSNDQFGSIYQTVRLNYLNLPVLLNYHFDEKTSIAFGPEFGYLLSAQLVIDRENNFNVTKQYPPKFDVGASMGLQYKLIKNTSIEIRYNYGFNTLYSTDAIGNRYTEKKGANRVFQIGFNYVFHEQKQLNH